MGANQAFVDSWILKRITKNASNPGPTGFSAGQTIKYGVLPVGFLALREGIDPEYGMEEGTVEHVSADAADNNTGSGNSQTDPAKKNQPLVYKALVALKQMNLITDGQRFGLPAGMQSNAEIRLGDRTVVVAGQKSVA